MATYLELAQKVAAESGTIASGEPLSVVGQTGRLADIVRWTADAWDELQRLYDGWHFRWRELDAQLLAGQTYHADTDFGLAAGSVGRWNDGAAWGVYDPTVGRSSLQWLQFERYTEFRARLMPDPDLTQPYPTRACIAPDGRLGVRPKVSTDMRIVGAYRAAVQRLVANDDVPGMPSDYHDAIVWFALANLVAFDEAPTQMPYWMARLRATKAQMERDLLDPLTIILPAGGIIL